MNIIDTLSSKELNKLIIKKYHENDIVYRENDKCKSVAIVLKGQVNIQTYLNDGNEVIYNIVKETKMFGNNLIFSSSPYYKGDVIAKKETEIAFINKNDLLDILQNNQNFLIEYLNNQADFTKELNNRIKLLSISSALERFYFYMHIHNNEIEYSSISNLANELYMKRETLSRIISRLNKQYKILKTENKIKLN